MGFLKKIAKKGLNLYGGGGLLGKFLSGGGSGGPDNPFAQPDPYMLMNPVNAGPAPSYDFLRTGPGDYFNELTRMIGAPSSVDAVRGEVENERVGQLLQGIESDTNKGLGKGVGSFYRRGLINPNMGGVSSDIASTGLASIVNEGQKRSADVRTNAFLAELERLGGREKAMRDAYGTQYQMANQRELALADILSGNYNQAANRQNQRDIAAVTGQAGLYNAGAERKEAGKKPRYLESFMGNFAGGAGQGAGQALPFLFMSDRRVKKNLQPLGNILGSIAGLRGVRFEYIDPKYSPDGRRTKALGLIAQDLEKEFPELVFAGSDDFKRIDYGPLAAVFVEAIKALTRQNEILRQRLDAMEAGLIRPAAAS